MHGFFFINKRLLISCDTGIYAIIEDQRQVSTAAAIEKRGTAETMVGQKSGPALAGPAAPATTALHCLTFKKRFELMSECLMIIVCSTGLSVTVVS